MFILSGGPARRGHAFAGARIIDVAPTILYLMGHAIPADMDGRPLLDALDPAFVDGRAPQVEGGAELAPVAAGPDAAFSAEEEDMIAERLRSLGYIE